MEMLSKQIHKVESRAVQFARPREIEALEWLSNAAEYFDTLFVVRL
jgi:hypothetical protein